MDGPIKNILFEGLTGEISEHNRLLPLLIEKLQQFQGRSRYAVAKKRVEAVYIQASDFKFALSHAEYKIKQTLGITFEYSRRCWAEIQ